MNKEEIMKPRYCIQWDAHAKHVSTVLCSLMEHQSLVDLAICCGNNTIHAHKCILAANSPYFREQLEKNSTAEQVIINGIDFIIIKSIVEFMYCGETNILEENLKYTIAVAKFFQMRGLQALETSHTDVIDDISIPPPIFLSKKPKYPTAYRPYNNNLLLPNPMNKAFAPIDPFVQRKVKRKYIRSEAERACAKEAAASRLALEALQKELSTTPQVNSFVIEESCTETTVENFIPHNDESFIENINEIQGMQIVNYADLSNGVYSSAGHIVNVDKPIISNPLIHYNVQNNIQDDQLSATDKLKHMVENNNDYQIMFQTNDGKFLNVPEDVLENLKRTLHYQVLDENVHIIEPSENKTYEITNQYIDEQTPKSITNDQTFVEGDLNINTIENSTQKTFAEAPLVQGANTETKKFEADSVFNKDGENDKASDADKYFAEETECATKEIDMNETKIVADDNKSSELKENKTTGMLEYVQNDYFITHPEFIHSDSKACELSIANSFNIDSESTETNRTNPLNFYHVGDSLFNLHNNTVENELISLKDGGGDYGNSSQKLQSDDCVIPSASSPKNLAFGDSFLTFESTGNVLSHTEFSPRRTRSNFKFPPDENVKDVDAEASKPKNLSLKKKK